MTDSNNTTKTYTHKETCGNCGRVNIVAIPKGVLVLEYLQHKECSNCGVKLRGSTFRPGGIYE